MPTTYFRNLVPGQWQIGDIVMGPGTNIRVETINNNPYDIDKQDYQRARADEINFGKDSWKPTSLEFTFEVLHNRMLPGYESTKPNFWHNMYSITDLKREWRSDEVRKVWGQLKPIYVCSKYDEIQKVILGRTGQFGETQDDLYNNGEVVKVIAEFRRADTYAYSIGYNSVTLTAGAPVQHIFGTNGEGPSWLRLLLQGPMNHPIINFANLHDTDSDIQINLNYNIPSGKIVEINGEPWARRVVDNSDPPLSLSSKLIGDTPYLDKLAIDFDGTTTISGSSLGSGQIQVVWRDSYQVI